MNKTVLILLLIAICISSSPLFAQKTKKVLLINSYSFDQKWTCDITSSIKKTFKHKDIQLLVEFMDTKRHNEAEHYKNLKELFQYKYSNSCFDLIMTSDDNAANFVLENRDTLFTDVPVIFCGVNNIAFPDRDDFINISGSLEIPDFERTIDLALQLHPEMDTLYLVNESSTSGESDRELLNTVLAKYSEKLTIHWLEDYSDKELASKLKTINSTSFVLLLSFFPNKRKNVFSMSDGATFISNHCKQPVYSMWEYFLGMGIVGGKLTSGTYQGLTAAEMALSVLNGASPASIPVSTHSANHYMFDYHYLEKFNIDIHNLPAESVIINTPQKSVLELYTIEIISAVLIILLLSLFCLLLLLNIRYRKKAETSLSISLQEKNTLLSELYHRTKNNMQVVSSFLFLESSLAKSKETITALTEAANRIETMSLVHQMLYKSQNLAHISVKKYITDLVSQIKSSFSTSANRIVFNIDILESEINIDVAIPLGLVINELLSNVLKHAFPENSGTVCISIKTHDKSSWELAIEDDGVGFSEDNIHTTSLGLSIVENLVTHQLCGTLKRTINNGTAYSIVFNPDLYQNRL